MSSTSTCAATGFVCFSYLLLLATQLTKTNCKLLRHGCLSPSSGHKTSLCILPRISASWEGVSNLGFSYHNLGFLGLCTCGQGLFFCIGNCASRLFFLKTCACNMSLFYEHWDPFCAIKIQPLLCVLVFMPQKVWKMASSANILLEGNQKFNGRNYNTWKQTDDIF